MFLFNQYGESLEPDEYDSLMVGWSISEEWEVEEYSLRNADGFVLTVTNPDGEYPTEEELDELCKALNDGVWK